MDTIYKIWEGVLGEEGLSIASEKEVRKVIEDFIIPDKINPLAFSDNYETLLRGGMPSAREFLGLETGHKPTASLSQFARMIDRPVGMPLWFIATYPDVLLWYDNTVAEYMKTHMLREDSLTLFSAKLCGIDVLSPNLKEEDLVDSEGKIRPNILRNLVESYKDKAGKELETAIKTPEDDIYLGSELLETFGTENNFVLIATNTTKYYLELTRHCSNRFSDEVSLLATAGLLDAKNYIFIEQAINPSEILDMAQRSALLGEEALIDFIINLEIKMFAIDTPNIDISDIEMACIGMKEDIASAIRKTKKQYVSEPIFASAVSNFMNSSQFKAFA